MNIASKISVCSTVSLIAVLLFSLQVSAAVKMPGIISNNMVLQRDIKVPIWGWANPGENLTIKFADQIKSTTADDSGKWMIFLDPMKANKTPQNMNILGDNNITIQNILIGEVWICSGQSNMELIVNASMNAAQERGAAKDSEIRCAKIPHNNQMAPVKDVPTTWVQCSPQTVGNFTAVGYYFARKLKKELDVPIGLISSNWGGTKVEPWIPPVGFLSVPELKWFHDLVNSWDPNSQAGAAARNKYVADVKKWAVQVEEAVDKKAQLPPAPKAPGPSDNHQDPTKLYNGMIHPLIPYAIRGAIWYQGESNGGEGISYFHKKQALINGWRKLWNQGNFPFYFVQLANFRKSDPNNAAGGDGWAKIREAQRKCLEIPNTGMAVIIDIGEANSIHPKNKQDVGTRLALWALKKDYKKNIVFSGPLYHSLKIDGNKAIVRFENVGSGLMIGSKKGLEPTSEVPDGKLTWFSVAGKDKVWHKATAVIEGDTVVVTSDKVPSPVAVRYAFAMNPEGCNLYNKEGLPASPFRTDNW